MTIENTGLNIDDPDVFMLHNLNNLGLSESPNGIHTGSNGGYQAVNIATLSGATKILLLGYDMHYPKGKTHWHKGHEWPVHEDQYRNYANKFRSMLPTLRRLGIKVINCTPDSRIDAFEKGDIESILNEPK